MGKLKCMAWLKSRAWPQGGDDEPLPETAAQMDWLGRMSPAMPSQHGAHGGRHFEQLGRASLSVNWMNGTAPRHVGD